MCVILECCCWWSDVRLGALQCSEVYLTSTLFEDFSVAFIVWFGI